MGVIMRQCWLRQNVISPVQFVVVVVSAVVYVEGQMEEEAERGERQEILPWRTCDSSHLCCCHHEEC